MARWLKVAAAAAVLCVFAWASASAAEGKKGDRPKRDPAEMFKKLDTNSDGKISLEEWLKAPFAKDEAKAKERFTKLDTDKDGFLSLDEFKAGHEQRGEGGKRGGGKKK